MEMADIEEPANHPQVQISNFPLNLEHLDGNVVNITGLTVARDVTSDTVHVNTLCPVTYQTILPPKDVTPKLVRFKKKNPTNSFVGRADFLQDLHTRLQSDCKFTVIAATGGIGKTETARKYIYDKDHAYDHIVWIDAQEVRTAESRFLELARALGVATKSEKDEISLERIVVQTYAKLCRNGNTLLVVFDNAEITTIDDAQESTIVPFLPKELNSFCVTPSILVTSRSQDWDEENYTIINLDLWSLDECIAFIILKLNPADSDNSDFIASATELSELFDKLPIALLAAVAVIVQESAKCKVNGLGHYGMENLIIDYKKSTNKVLAKRPTKSTSSQTMLVLWDVTFGKVVSAEHGVLAINVLSAMAFMSPIGIPKALLFRIFEKNCDHLTDALILLRNYSFIADTESPSQQYTIHRVIQDVTIEHLKASNGPYKGFQSNDLHCSDNSVLRHLSQQLLSYVQSDLQNDLDPDESILENIVRVTQHVTTKLEVQEFYQLTYETAMLLYRVNDYTQSHSLFLNLLHFNEQFQGGDVAKVSHQIAKILRKQGKYQESIDWFKKTLHMKVSNLEEIHIKSGIAVNHQTLNDLDEALKWNLEVLKDHESLDPPEPGLELATKALIAEMHLKQGDYTRALQEYKAVLMEQEELFGPEHVDIVPTKIQIANTLNLLGHLEEAAALCAQLQGLCAPSHEYYIAARANSLYGQILRKLGKLDEAKSLFDDLLKSREKVLTPNHPSILEIKALVGSILFCHGTIEALDEALDVLKTVARELENIYGGNHPLVLTVKNNWASALLAKNEYEEALKIFMEVCRVQKTALGKNHPDTLHTKFMISRVYEATGQYAKGVKLALHVLLAKQSISQIKDPPFVVVAQLYLALVNQLCTRPEIASLTEDEVYVKFMGITGACAEDSRRQLLESNEDLRSALLRFATANINPATRKLFVPMLPNVPPAPQLMPDYENAKLNDFMKATACPSVETAIKFLQNSNGKVHIALAKWLTTHENHQIDSRYEIKEKEFRLFNALEKYLERLSEQRASLGPTHPDTLATDFSLCQIYFAVGQYGDSAELALCIFNGRKQILNVSIPPTCSDILLLYCHSVRGFLRSPQGDQAVEEKGLLEVFMEISHVSYGEAQRWLQDSSWDLEGALIRFTGTQFDVQTRKIKMPIFDSNSQDLSPKHDPEYERAQRLHFMVVTLTTEEVANNFLHATNWDVTAAIDKWMEATKDVGDTKTREEKGILATLQLYKDQNNESGRTGGRFTNAGVDRSSQEALLIANFQVETGVDLPVADSLLKASNWNFDVALERFYYTSRTTTVAASSSSLEVKSQPSLTLQKNKSTIESPITKATGTWLQKRRTAPILPQLYFYLVEILHFEPFFRPIWPSFSLWPWCLGILKVPAPAVKVMPTTPEESEPTTEIAIKCPDGTRLRGHFKESDTVNELYEFVNKERPDLGKVVYVLTHRPNIKLIDKEQTLKEENMLKSVLQVQLIK